jgi:hypothetical protein
VNESWKRTARTSSWRNREKVTLAEHDRDRAAKDRIARNEVIFREVNQRVADVMDSDARMANFLCECGNLDCLQEISPTVAEYRRLRSNPATFAVVPGHSLADVETTVEETDRSQIVEKHPREAAMAQQPIRVADISKRG